MPKAATDTFGWPLESSVAGDPGLVEHWTLSWSNGAQAVRWRGGALAGPGELERFNPKVDTGKRLWPERFEYSPSTGETLSPALSQLPPTAGRLGSVCGLPILDVPQRSLSPESPKLEPLPSGAFYFAQGGTPGFLFATDLKAGVVFRRKRLEDGWANHGRYPRSSLEPWSNGLVGTHDAIYYAGDAGLVRLNEDPEDDGAEQWPLPQPVAAPALVGDIIAIPHIDAGDLKLGWRELGEDIKTIHALAVAGGDGAAADLRLGFPCIGAGDIAYWVGRQGFLTFELTRQGAEAAWRPWGAEFVALPQLRPYRSANGALWAFGLTEVDRGGAGRAAVAELSATGSARVVRTLEGPHVSAGEATYRNKSRYDRPWEEPTETVQTGNDMSDCWLLPLATLPGGDVVVALVSEAATMRAFLFREGRARPRSAHIFLHRPNGGLAPMHHSLDLSSTCDLDLFPSEGRLCLYHREDNRCVSWPLV